MADTLSHLWRLVPLTALALSGCHHTSELERARAHPKFDLHLHIAHGQVSRAATMMEREGVVGGVNLSGGPAGEGLEQSLAETQYAPHVKLLVFANVDWNGLGTPGWTEREVARLELAAKEGAAGLKIFKTLGLGVRDSDGKLARVDDPRIAPIFEAAGRLHLPVAIHTGDPKAFFIPDSPQNERHEELSLHPNWSFARPGYPSWEELYAEFENVVRAHPQTTFIGLHFGNDPEEPFRVGQMLDRYPNLYVDVAARVGEIGRQDPKKLRALFIAHRDRIFFGTDWAVDDGHMVLGAGNGHPETLADLDTFFARTAEFFETDHARIAHPVPIQGHWTVDAIDLPDDVLQAVYTGNAMRLFHLASLPAEQPVPK